MNDDKQQRLTRHKQLATGLFVAMLILYSTMLYLTHTQPTLTFVGYVKAFAEAAMVGALADWFAVTALFHHPLGLPIPHTNLIMRKKNDIGENLGTFVVDNFLKAEQLRPYVAQLSIGRYLTDWLNKERNITQIKQWLTKAVEGETTERLTSKLFGSVAGYLTSHQSTLQGEINKQLPTLVPDFIKNIISESLLKGTQKLLTEAQADPEHALRTEVQGQLHTLANELPFLEDLKAKLRTLQPTIDSWVQKAAYQFVLRNRHEVGRLISNTVANWDGAALSEKLELEVGKDLQFIRINGTLVGGLVGLLIYVVTQVVSG